MSQVLVALPRDATDVVAVCNFAANNQWKVRAQGHSHNWSPLSFPPPGMAQNANKTVLVDTSCLDTKSAVVKGQGASARLHARFGTGVTLAEATRYMETFANPLGPTAAPGFTFSNMPAPGNLSLGGVLAIGGHGTSVPWNTTESEPALMGCLSNVIERFTAIVYDGGAYTTKTFDRTATEAPAFVVHLGRSFITEVTLVAIPNYWVDTLSKFPDMNDVMADPPASPDAFCNLTETYGRVEVIWFPWQPATAPYTGGGKAWVQCFERRTTSGGSPPQPNDLDYKWMNLFNEDLSNAIRKTLHDRPELTPTWLAVGAAAPELMMPAVIHGTAGTRQIYVGDNTLRLTAFGYTVQLPRQDLQHALHSLYTTFVDMIGVQAKNTRYPISGPLEIRVTTLDQQQDPGISGTRPAALAATHAVDPTKGLDTLLWISNLTFPRTAGASTFWHDLEEWMIKQWDPSKTWVIRPEWSKGFAYVPEDRPNPGPWNWSEMMKRVVSTYNGASDGLTFDWAKGVLAGYDPKNIFSNTWLDELFS